MKKHKITKLISLSLFATILSVLFVFLGAPVLRVIRNCFGSFKFWIAGVTVLIALTAAQMGLVGFLAFSLWVTIGVYAEFEERGRASLQSAFIAIALGSCVLMGGPVLLFKIQGADVYEAIKLGLEEILSKSLKTGGGNQSALGLMPVSLETLMAQIPSMVFLSQLISLAFALMLDKKAASMLGMKFEKVASQIKLLEFKVPEWLIWPTLLSLLFTFTKVDVASVNTVAANMLNVFLGLYFFQGLAILEVALLVFQAGLFTRVLIYFVLVGQLFLILSAVGLTDYWLDLRTRLRKNRRQQGHEKNGEKL